MNENLKTMRRRTVEAPSILLLIRQAPRESGKDQLACNVFTIKAK